MIDPIKKQNYHHLGLSIFFLATVNLDDLDVHNVNDSIKIEPDIILNDVEILS